jgi:hypothetical protein
MRNVHKDVGKKPERDHLVDICPDEGYEDSF